VAQEPPKATKSKEIAFKPLILKQAVMGQFSALKFHWLKALTTAFLFCITLSTIFIATLLMILQSLLIARPV
jgi:hypothetical protein